MKRPEEKKIDQRFNWTFQNSLIKKYNQGRQDMITFLPSIKELIDLVKGGCAIENMMACVKANDNTPFVEAIAKAIHKRLGGS